eukprot:scaffold1085_cov407-Prasinococcus_capsulatus_cf.AAC.26
MSLWGKDCLVLPVARTRCRAKSVAMELLIVVFPTPPLPPTKINSMLGLCKSSVMVPLRSAAEHCSEATRAKPAAATTLTRASTAFTRISRSGSSERLQIVPCGGSVAHSCETLRPLCGKADILVLLSRKLGGSISAPQPLIDDRR